MSSHTNPVKYYTDPASCPYAKSDNTGCTFMVMWGCGPDGTGSMGWPLELHDKDRDGFPLIHDCRPKRQPNRIPHPDLEPEEYRKYMNKLKDDEWAEAMREPTSQIRKMGMAAEQVFQLQKAEKKHYISEVCTMCTKQIFRERGHDISWKEIGVGQAFDDESATKVHDCLEGVNERNVQILNTKIKILEDRIQQQEKAYERRLKNLEQYIGRAFF